MSLIESETDARLPQAVASDMAQSPALTGATMGAAIGAGLGALDGVGAITIPFTDPLVATGWVLPCVVFAIIGAIIGAVVGIVTRAGVSNKQGHTLASGLQKGEQLVMVRVSDANIAAAEAVFARTREMAKGRAPDPVAREDIRPRPVTVEEQAETAYRD